MALTANITTPDGGEHPEAFASVYPVTLQTVPNDFRVNLTLHCWHSQAAKEAGMSELAGYPQPISLEGEQAQAAIVAGMAPLAAVKWTDSPIINAGLAEATIIGAVEDIVIEQFPMFSKVTS